MPERTLCCSARGGYSDRCDRTDPSRTRISERGPPPARDRVAHGVGVRWAQSCNTSRLRRTLGWREAMAWLAWSSGTNSTLSTVAADETHRDQAIIEQVIAELKNGPLAHAPSGKFAANAAWLTLACLAFNVLRAAGIGMGIRCASSDQQLSPRI